MTSALHLESFGANANQDPAGYYRDLAEVRAACPVRALRSSTPGSFVTLSYDTVATVLGASDTFTPSIVSEQYGPVLGADTPVGLTGWRHRANRRLITRELSGVHFHDYIRPLVEEAVGSCLDRALANAGPVDLVDAIALRLPVLIVGSLLGIDESRLSDLRVATAAMFRFANEPRRGLRAARWLRAFLSDEVMKRRKRPRDDLLTRLVFAPEQLSAHAIVTVALLILAAGVETSCDALSVMLAVALNSDEGDLAVWAEAPGTVVEELLRWESPAQLTVRSVTKDVTLAGVQMWRGATVLAHIGAANHDPDAFPSPEALLPVRPPSRRHLAFGAGEHRCPGRDIARTELSMVAQAMPSLAKRLRVSTAPPQVLGSIFRGVSRIDAEVLTGGRYCD